MWIFGRHRHLAEEKLSDYVSGRLSPYQKGRLERSLDECATCRQELASLQWTASLLRELPAHELPRSFVLAAAPAGAPAVPGFDVNATRGWTFRPPGWAYAGAASVVGLAVAIFVFSSEVSLWLPGDAQEVSQSGAVAEVSALPASQPARMASVPESQASVPPLPEPAAEVEAMAETEAASDAHPPPAASLAAPAAAPTAQPESRVKEPTPAPEAAFFAPESYEEPIQDVAAAPAVPEAASEPVPMSTLAPVPMAREQVEAPAAGRIESSEQDSGTESLPLATVEAVLAMAEAPLQDEAVALAPQSVGAQSSPAAVAQESPTVSPRVTSGPSNQVSPQPEAKAEASASDQPAAIAGSSGGMAEPQQTVEPPKLDSSEVTAGVAVPEEAAQEDSASPETPLPEPRVLASTSPDIETMEAETALAVAPDLPSSVPDQEILQPAPAMTLPPEPVVSTAGEGSPGPAGSKGLPGEQVPAGAVGGGAMGPVGPQGSPEIRSEEGSITGSTGSQGSEGLDRHQAPQPSTGNEDTAIPGFGIRYEVLLAIAGIATALILILVLIGLYRYWAARQAGGKSGTNGGVDPSLMVNRPKLGNGGG